MESRQLARCRSPPPARSLCSRTQHETDRDRWSENEERKDELGEREMRSRRTAEQPSQPSIPLILSRSPALSLSVPPPSFLPQLARSFTKSKFTAAISAASSQRVRSESSQFALRARKMYKKDDRSLSLSPHSFRYNYHHRLARLPSARCSVGYSCRLNLLNGRLIISRSLSLSPSCALLTD